MIKGLAKLKKNRLRHDRLVKYVDVSLFRKKRGYSPMTTTLYRAVVGEIRGRQAKGGHSQARLNEKHGVKQSEKLARLHEKKSSRRTGWIF